MIQWNQYFFSLFSPKVAFFFFPVIGSVNESMIFHQLEPRNSKHVYGRYKTIGPKSMSIRISFNVV